jgi:hypothetical protein
MNVTIALAVGYVLYRLIKTKNSPTKASDYGRNWMAWMALFATLSGLPKVIMEPSPDMIFKFISSSIVFILIAFILGFVYGKFKVRKKSPNNPSVEVVKQPDATLNNQISDSGVNCSSCGAEIKPKGAKFCGRCGAKFEPPKINNVNTDSGTQTKTVSQNISSSSTSKAETVRPPTIEKKIADEARPENNSHAKKEEKISVYPVMPKNTKANIIMFSILAIVIMAIFS